MLRQALQGYRQAVRRPAFRWFWLGMMISRAGDAFTVVALSWVVLGLAVRAVARHLPGHQTFLPTSAGMGCLIDVAMDWR